MGAMLRVTFFAHCGKSSDETGLLDMAWWARKSRGRDWPACLQRRQDESEVAALRLSTHRGRPLGSDSFMSKLEKLVGRSRMTKENPKALTQGKKRRMKPKQK